MDPNEQENEQEISQDFPPFFRVYKNGHISRYLDTDFVPPSEHPKLGVISKDVIISHEPKVSARIYLPKSALNQSRKFPVLVYVHGGAFSIESAFSSLYHNYLNNLVSESEVVAVSVEYRLAPENPIPACYDDSWRVLNWVASHGKYDQNSEKPEKPDRPEKVEEPWLRDFVDYDRVFLGGDSAGANIAHDLLVRASSGGFMGLMGLKIEGVILVHPFFGCGKKPDKLWEYINPETSGLDDPRLNPAAHVDLLSKLVCKRILVCTAERDGLRKRGWSYYESVKRSGWNGELEIVETKGQSHVFHLMNPSCEDAGVLLRQVISFIKKTGLASL